MDKDLRKNLSDKYLEKNREFNKIAQKELDFLINNQLDEALKLRPEKNELLKEIKKFEQLL
ncbi:hypothetical protein ACWV26_07295 [Rummeliibacillus sp. JY-2-4R]